MLSLKTRIIIGLTLVALYGFMIIGMAVNLPASNKVFSQSDSQLLAQPPASPPITVTAFSDGTSQLPADTFLLLEEPDVLATYDDLNRFFHIHQQLATWLANDALFIIDDRGQPHVVSPQARTLTHLPGLFWLQLLCGLAGMVICVLVWVPAKREVAINSFAITGLSYVLFSSAAAIYSTRDFFMAGPLFVWLSGLNHFGALLFSASLGAFLWNYPRKAPSVWITAGFYLAFAIAIAIDQLQLVTSPVEGFHTWVMAIFLAGLLGAVWQWLKTRQQPEHRSALRWVVISIITGTVFFAGGMILPAMLQVAEPASQGILFTTFLLMYLGMALGVVRHRLFNLEKWWFSLWSWLLGGLFIMLTDLVLAMILSLSGPVTLTLSVALIGWLYFPLRQHLWKTLFLSNHQGLEAWLSQALPAMLEVQRKTQSESGMEEALQAVFQPLAMESQPLTDTGISIHDRGETLNIPDPLARRTWSLHHAQQGERVFNRDDIRTAGLVLSLNQLVNQAHEAHALGAREERLRIRRDMHDDLGAKLLQLLHRSTDGTKPLVREAIQDLRDLLKDMEGESLSLEAAVLQWYEETEQRCNDHGTKLQWQTRTSATVLSASEFSELTRILREAVTNALKHASTTELVVTLDSQAGTLELTIENDGVAVDQALKKGRGMDIMTSRARKLGGSFRHESHSDRWRLILCIPLASRLS
ncbi:ATPase family protein [Alcanivorax hongdengensis A-11-3]|uniref:histidine kinase n=1 Tax=Alcanivorax hongdengensis A-11-3 TaxID=1177179 RepID=L0WEI9_9GAMM|nr:ATP-binding protein [Alcanivorax hongdengensis]EKF74572.1 ATPase family protein [Alcanivorax hongdengensis A-11-3]